ncbi:YhaN family protein [Microvirga sp. VF16]|uniref:YhaN family protein n=1 Tax=Microvirga sp. VF16 TaxID=2807101 RepID=UPI00193CA0C0|nr:YhaN family protein [Microvirga sp. VF16]QRM35843.1 AAA family ATPase [Microvirga sp. VF16]
MKLETLTLERYGRFEDLTLDLTGSDVRLHIVFGPNEAGKSTLLSSVVDLLFGIPMRSPYGFRFDYSQMRVGATLANDAGERLSFKRRKGKGTSGTLLSDQEAALPDAALTRFLGSADRELFERMFGLDHQRLRLGGKKMLESGGDLTTSLFEAGSGLTRVGDALRRIEDEIGKLGALDQRKSAGKPIWQQIDRFTKAQQAMRLDALKTDEWRQAEASVEAARERRRNLDEAMTQLRRKRSRLERIRRVNPILAAILQRESRLTAFGPTAATLPETFEREWRSLDSAVREAATGARRAEDLLQQLETEIAAEPKPKGLPARTAEITALNEALGDYRKKLADEPKLMRDKANDDSQIAGHLQQLGLTLDPATVEAQMPSAPLISRLRELARSGQAVLSRLEVLEADLKEAREAFEAAQRKLQALSGSTADPAGATGLLNEILQLGDVSSLLAQADIANANAKRDLAEALSRVPRWTGTTEDLAARPVPGIELVAQYDQAWRKAVDSHETAERKLIETDNELQQVKAEIIGLAATGEVPSPAAVKAARDHRDMGWRLVRTRLIDAHVPIDELSAFAPSGDLAGSFETALRHADELVDRREHEGHRVARLTDLAAQKERLAAALDAARLAEERAQAELGSLQGRWIALWADCGTDPGTPAEMLIWLRQRDEVVRLLTASRRSEEALDQSRAIAANARCLATEAAGLLGVSTDHDETFSVLFRRVQQAHSSALKTWTERQALATSLQDLQHRVARLEKDVARAAAERTSWLDQWADAVTRLQLPADALPAEAEAALSIWDSIRDRSTNRSQTMRRLDGLRKDLQQFRSDVLSLHASLGAMAADFDTADPEKAVRMLYEQLREDMLQTEKLAELARRVEKARNSHTDAFESLRVASERMDHLLRQSGLDANADPLAVAAEAQEYRTIASELAEKRNELAKAGDGLGEDALRQEAGSISPDENAAELSALEKDEERLVGESQAAAQAETEAERLLRDLAGRKGAAEAAQEAQNAALGIGICAERWMRLEAARRILERAMERYRAANEHPLVRRASEIFGLIAGTGPNPLARLAVRYRDGDAPTLIGLRADGSECDVEGMSEGTRDQLYLALRIATIERHVVENEALPFLADDLFITSDDERVVPGLAALAELGRSTQVILFTHHRHVLDAAFSTLPSGSVMVHRLQSHGRPVELRAVAS